jgi:hypothetical protein
MNMISASSVLFEYRLLITSTSDHVDRGGEQSATLVPFSHDLINENTSMHLVAVQV